MWYAVTQGGRRANAVELRGQGWEQLPFPGPAVLPSAKVVNSSAHVKTIEKL